MTATDSIVLMDRESVPDLYSDKYAWDGAQAALYLHKDYVRYVVGWLEHFPATNKLLVQIYNGNIHDY